jgi:hypothetical protein
VESPFYQVGFVVEDIEAAMAELSASIGVTWEPVRDVTIGEWDIRVSFTVEGPPHLELIEGEPGGPWDTANGSRIDHIGFWSKDVPADKASLVASGLPIHVDGAELGAPHYVYHSAPASGMRVELISSDVRAAFYERLGRPDPAA